MRFVFSLTLSAFCIFSSPAQSTHDSIVFDFKAGPQFWRVPDGITSVSIDAYGAQGGSARGGKGGRVQSDLTIKPASNLVMYIGSQPHQSQGGENGGGRGCGNGTGGGGATDIRIGGTDLRYRILVAGGSGGYGYGGTAGSGGGLSGGDGHYDGSAPHIAHGGSQTSPGTAASAYSSLSGNMASGGEGINDRSHQCTNGAMAGGGGGYYGGGAGGAGGGGGGSSYTDPQCNKNVIHTQGVKEGNGKIIIRWHK
jgi:hypothetical protein